MQQGPGTRYALPDGSYVMIPDNITPKQLEKVLYGLSELYPEEIGKPFYESQRSLPGHVGSFIAGIPRGAASTALTGIQGLAAALTPGVDTGFERGLAGLQEKIASDPAYRDAWSSKLGTGLGSLVPFLGAAAVTGGGVVAPAAIGALVGSGEQAQRILGREATGENVGFIRETAALGLGAATGLTEAWAPTKIIKKIPGARKAAEQLQGARELAGVLTKIPKGARITDEVLGLIPGAVGSALREGTQEVAQAVMQDAIERGIYNPDLPVGQSVMDDFLVGGFAGGVADILISGLAGRAGRRVGVQKAQEAAAIIDRENELRKYRDARLAALQQADLDRTQDPGDRQLELALEEEYEDALHMSGFDIVSSPTGIGYSVRDRSTGLEVRDIPVMGTPEEARAFADKLSQEQIELAFATGTHIKLENQGLERSVTGLGIAHQATHPDAVLFPAYVPAQYIAEEGEVGGEPGAAYSEWRARHPKYADRSTLTAREVAETTDEVNRNRIFLDRARVTASAYVDAMRKLNAERRESGQLPALDLDPASSRFLGDLASQYNNFPDADFVVDPTGKELSGARGMTDTMLRDLLKQKNIVLEKGRARFDKKTGVESPALAYFMESVAGTSNWHDMTMGQRIAVLSSLAQVPASPTAIRMPDVSPPKYNRRQRAIVLDMLKAAGKDGLTVADVAKSGKVALDKEAIEQMFSHMRHRAGGRIRSKGDGIVLRPKEESTVADRTPVDVRAQVFGDEFGLGGFMEVAPEDAESDDILRRFFEEQFALADEVATKESGKPADEVEGSIPEKVQFGTKATKAWREVHRAFEDSLRRLGFSESDISIMDPAEAENEVRRALVEAASGKRDPKNKLAAFDPTSARIAVLFGAVDPDGTMNSTELAAATIEAFHHETFEAIIGRGYLNDSQINALLRAATTNVVPEAVDPNAHEQGMSWYDKAAMDFPDSTQRNIEIEAMSNMWAAYRSKKLQRQKSAGLVGSIFRSMSRIVDASADAAADTYLRQAFSVFSKVERGDIARRGPGRDFVNPKGEVRAPDWMIQHGMTEERAAEIKNQIDSMQIMDGVIVDDAFGLTPDGPVIPSTETEPGRIDPRQRELFDEFVDGVTDRNGKLELLKRLGIPHGVHVEMQDGERGKQPAIVLTLPVTTDSNVRRGVAKVLGDAFFQGASEVRVVVPNGTLGKSAVGVTLQFPEGMDVEEVYKALSVKAQQEYLGIEGNVTKAPLFKIDRVGSHMVVLDLSSTDPEYNEDDAIKFVDTIREMTAHLPGLEANGFFMDVDQFAHESVYPDGMPDGVESYEGGINELQEGVGPGPYDYFADPRNVDDGGTGEAEVAADGSVRPSGPSDLQRTAIRDLYEIAHPVVEKLREARAIDEPLLKRYRTPGTAVNELISDADAVDALATLAAEKAETPPGIETETGIDASPEAVKARYDGLRFGVDTIAPDFFARYSSTQSVDPEISGILERVTTYDIPDHGPRVTRFIDFLDSPDKWGDMKAYLRDKGRYLRYQTVERHLPTRETDEAVAERTGKRMLASTSAYGAAALMRDQTNAIIGEALTKGPPRYVTDNIEGAGMGHIDETLASGGIDLDTRGFVDEDGNAYKGITDIFRLLDSEVEGERKANDKMADLYLIAKRVLDMIDLGRQSKEVLDSGVKLSPAEIELHERNIRQGSGKHPGRMTEEEANMVIDHIEANRPDIVKFAKGYRAMNKWLLEFMVSTGQIDPNSPEYKQWSERMTYVPFTRQAIYQKHFVSKWQRDKQYRDANADLLIERELEGGFTGLDIPLLERTMANVAGILTDGSLNVHRARTARNLLELGAATRQAEPGKRKANKNYIAWKERGVTHEIEVVDPLVADAVASAQRVIDMHPAFSFVMMAPAKIARALITRNPIFIARQAMRDPIAGYAVSGAFGNGLDGVIESFRGYAEKLSDPDSFEKAIARRISAPYDVNIDPQNVRQTLKEYDRAVNIESESGNPFVYLWDKLGRASRRAESATRMKVWDEVYTKTGDMREADLQALEIVNFGRRGKNPWFSLVLASVPFLNARIQGLDVMYRSLKGDYTAMPGDMTREEIRHNAVTRGAVLTGITAMYWLMWQGLDDEEYDNQRPDMRADNWIIPWFGDTVVTIPIAFEAGVLYKAMPEAILNALFKDRGAEGFIDDSVRQLYQQVNIQPPQAVKPLFENLMNKELFSGYDILPRSLEDVDTPYQYTNRTTMLSRGVGKLTGKATHEAFRFSPVAIDHTINSYVPGIAQYIVALSDYLARKALGETVTDSRSDPTRVSNYPGGSFFRQSGGGDENAFYELREKLDGIAQAMSKVQNEGKVAEYRYLRDTNVDLLSLQSEISRLSQYMGEWRQARNSVINAKHLSDSEKRERLDHLDEQKRRRLAIVPALKARLNDR